MTPEDRGPEWEAFYAACARAEVALDAFERRSQETAEPRQQEQLAKDMKEAA